MLVHVYCIFFPLFRESRLTEKINKQPLQPLFVITGGDRQGCREAELYSLMGEEHCISHRQSNGQSGGKSICLLAHYIFLYHSVYACIIAIFTNTTESRRLRITG